MNASGGFRPSQSTSSSRLFRGSVWVDYGQMYVDSSDGLLQWDMSDSFRGQDNGICGAATPHFLYLITGRHTGRVEVTVDVSDTPPPIDQAWDDVVEASFEIGGDPVWLREWGGEAHQLTFPGPGSYRVRYSALNTDAAQADEYLRDDVDEPPTDSYWLQFWLAPAASEVVVKQSTQWSAYWHRFARQLPPPPTPAEQAAAERTAEQLDREQREASEREIENAHWGGQPPTERQRGLRCNVLPLVALDRDLVDAITDASPAVQRRLAHWSAQWAFDQAGLSQLTWVAPALQAMHSGSELPPPFTSISEPFDRLFSDPTAPNRLVNSPSGGETNIVQSAMALNAVRQATAPDPLEAAIDALYCAVITVGDRYPSLFAEVRHQFPLS